MSTAFLPFTGGSHCVGHEAQEAEPKALGAIEDQTKGRNPMKRYAFLLALVCMIAPVAVTAEQSLDRLNVMDFGAKADGKADDTAAIVKAVEAGAEKKLPVCFPRGEYRVTKPLAISNQSLMGAEPGAWSSDTVPLPTIHVDHRVGPESDPSNAVTPSGPPAAPSNLVATPSTLNSRPAE